jgi:hypothetical protein
MSLRSSQSPSPLRFILATLLSLGSLVGCGDDGGEPVDAAADARACETMSGAECGDGVLCCDPLVCDPAGRTCIEPVQGDGGADAAACSRIDARCGGDGGVRCCDPLVCDPAGRTCIEPVRSDAG